VLRYDLQSGAPFLLPCLPKVRSEMLVESRNRHTGKRLSVFDRFSDPSATCLMCYGPLSSPICSPFAPNLNPNLAVTTTRPRKGARASPTSSSFAKGRYASAGQTALRPFQRRSESARSSPAFPRLDHIHNSFPSAWPDGRHFETAFSQLTRVHCVSAYKKQGGGCSWSQLSIVIFGCIV
jgi:hypothetical protein